MGNKSRVAGFTLMELLTVVAILGVLAAVAIPAYTGYMRRSKASEVTSNLNSLFKATASYYSMERSAIGIAAGASGNCIVNDAGPSPATPRPFKQKFANDPSFQTLGFSIADFVYYSYGMSSSFSSRTCGTSANQVVYTLYANGDLDADLIMSTFEMIVASTANNQLYHSVGFYIVREDE